jgi:hypothetical protein
MKPKTRARKLGDYFFTYSWGELAAVRPLRNTYVTFYASIGAAGFVLEPLGDRAASALLLGALACYPGFLLGLRSKRTENPSALKTEELMVWRVGFVAKVFSGIGVLLLIRHLLAN